MTEHNYNLNRSILKHAKYYPDEEVLVYGDRSWTYGQWVEEVKELAAGLKAQGVEPGDRVVYLGLNSSSFLRTMLAAWYIGAVYTPLNFRLAPVEVEDLITRARPAMVVIEASHIEVVERMKSFEQLRDKTQFVLIDNDPEIPAPEQTPEGYTLITDVINSGDVASIGEPRLAAEDDLALLLFTSGTTGLPKGVKLTFGNIWWNSVNVDAAVDTRRGDTNYVVAPMFHIGALNSFTIRCMARGGRNIIRRNFDPRQVVRDIEEYQVTTAFLVPAMLKAMEQTEEFEDHDISSLRSLVCAGAAVPPSLIKEYERKNVQVQQAWGLTETAPFATYLPAELTYKKIGSCGVPMEYTEARIMDPVTGEVIDEPNQTGEMCVRGPNVTPGYWENEEATRAAFIDGWFRSGDMGYKDEDGFFYIVDRLKDMIITGGENVYPAEIERVLSGYPGVTDVAVVGIEDPEWGEKVVAMVTVAEGHEPTVEDIREYCSDHLARYKLPKELVVSPVMYRNGSGKLDKRRIKAFIRGEKVDQ